MEQLKDYCSSFPEDIRGKEIGQSCCKYHDQDVGQAGTYNPITPHIKFYKCLKTQGVNLWMRSLITAGGTFFSWVKYPYFAYRIYKYRQKVS